MGSVFLFLGDLNHDRGGFRVVLLLEVNQSTIPERIEVVVVIKCPSLVLDFPVHSGSCSFQKTAAVPDSFLFGATHKFATDF